jgi:hypothetical protein
MSSVPPLLGVGRPGAAYVRGGLASLRSQTFNSTKADMAAVWPKRRQAGALQVLISWGRCCTKAKHSKCITISHLGRLTLHNTRATMPRPLKE